MSGHVLYHPYKTGDLLVAQFNKLMSTNFEKECPQAIVSAIAARWPLREKNHGEEWKRYQENFANFITQKTKIDSNDKL